MATQKTSNDYREERKARLAKASKMNSKKSHRLSAPKISKKIKATVGIIVAAAIVIAIAGYACYSFGVFERMKSFETVSGEKYSVVDYEYYYKSLHNKVYGMAYEYDNYYGQGYGYSYTGYDYNKLPEDQTYPYNDYTLEDGSKATWKQYFEHAALVNLQKNIVLSDMAKEADFEVSAEAKAEVEDQLQQLRDNIAESAEKNGGAISLGKYLRNYYGKGMSESKFLEIVERETLATEYANYLIETRADGYDLAKLEEIYNKDPKSYNCVDFRMFTISPETADLAEDATDEEKEAANEKAEAEAKKKADEMFGKIEDEKTFVALAEEYATEAQKESNDYSDSQTTLSQYVTYSTVSSNFSEDILDWLYGDKAAANEKKMFEENGTYYIFYMLKPAYRDDDTLPVNVRHILYQIDEEATDKEAESKKQKAAAEAALKKINESADKLATFLELVEAESADTGSSSKGGLYEYVGRGQYVKEFEAWALDPNRKEGDIDIVETSYGFHVMYFEKAFTKPYWQILIGNTLANESLTKELEAAYATDKYAVAANNATVTKANAKIYDELKNTYYSKA